MPPDTATVAKPHYWEEAVAHLVRRDRILKKIIPQHAEAWLTSRHTPFVTLARAIVGQQISSKAGDALWQRFLDAVGKRPTPAGVLGVGGATLRQAGLSQRKCEYVQDLAAHFGERRVHPEKWAAMDDESVVAELLAIRGIGRWTAEMFLIFNLQRPDVLPLDDPGLLKAISLHYFSGEPVSRFEAREVSSAWQPWRTVATWYLWRSLESKAVPN
ncbi:DNA-3-methyladenine glycosylase family protein [Bordetella petrii]|uniref:DNA-3-methyladenine glycosylase family protein n=1 Tax=Bordetella petrii TaxID=94624 RepID=UPI001E485DD7|nr:DNA-3-methyladenine glycosylase 2 family protein [Bordetella petrii]MCD0506116.1 DNA-3-methyladenine glycosylase 2 family protein [Bordetella petrii]